jgi:hypothetical protein
MCMTIHDGVVLRVCRGVQLWQHPRKGQSMNKFSDIEIAAQTEVGDRYPTRKSLRILRKKRLRLLAFGWFMVGASFATSVSILLVSL